MSTNSNNRIASRLDKLLAAAKARAKTRTGARKNFRCRGVPDSRLTAYLAAALPPGGEEVLLQIIEQIDAHHAKPLRELPSGEFVQERHGFMEWLYALQDGWATLPEQLPLKVLVAWRDGYTNHPAKSTPVAHIRCESCWLVLPNCGGSGIGHALSPCPVCGSDRLAYADLSKAPGAFLPAGR